MRKFLRQISNTMHQVAGDVHLDVPNLNIGEPSAVLDDFEIVNEIEAAVEKWTPQIQDIVEQHSNPDNNEAGTPVQAIEFWRDRNAALGAVFEQLNTPAVRKMIEVLKLCESQQYPAFEHQYTQLNKLYQEAKDNVKFLSTLERHFKNLHGDLAVVSVSCLF